MIHKFKSGDPVIHTLNDKQWKARVLTVDTQPTYTIESQDSDEVMEVRESSLRSVPLFADGDHVSQKDPQRHGVVNDVIVREQDTLYRCKDDTDGWFIASQNELTAYTEPAHKFKPDDYVFSNGRAYVVRSQRIERPNLGTFFYRVENNKGKETHIDEKDLEAFTPAFKFRELVQHVDGNCKGYVNDIHRTAGDKVYYEIKIGSSRLSPFEAHELTNPPTFKKSDKVYRSKKPHLPYTPKEVFEVVRAYLSDGVWCYTTKSTNFTRAQIINVHESDLCRFVPEWKPDERYHFPMSSSHKPKPLTIVEKILFETLSDKEGKFDTEYAVRLWKDYGRMLLNDEPLSGKRRKYYDACTDCGIYQTHLAHNYWSKLNKRAKANGQN